jgi:hypothetical protein
MKSIFTLIAAICVFATISVPVEARNYNKNYGNYYRSTDHSWVHGPEKIGNHGSVVAICADGTHSYSHHHQGTCSHHHGVASWK